MARTFNGTTDRVDVSTIPWAHNLSAFTALAIIRYSASMSAEDQLLAKHTGAFVGKLFLYFPNFSSRTNTIGTFITASTQYAAAMSVTDTLAVDTWTVCVSTWDGTNAPKVYTCAVGGTLTEVSYATSQAHSGTLGDESTATLRVATRDALDQFFAGDVCEVAIWNRVLGSSELADLGLGRSAAFSPSGLVVYLPLKGAESPEPSHNGTWSGTVSGTTQVTHPTIIYPCETVLFRQ